MANVSTDVLVAQLVGALGEGVEGSSNPWSYFIDSGADAALLGTLDKLSAAEASRAVAGSSVVAQAHHTLFGMRIAAAWARGEKGGPYRWEDSWGVRAADDAAWAALRRDLRAAYDDLCQAIRSHPPATAEAVGGAIGAVAHLAYHLGAIRQKVALVKQG